MNLDISNGSTLYDLWRDRNSSLHQYDTLVLQTRDPLDHLLAHLPLCDAHQCLYRISPLTQTQETHFVSLCTGSLDAGTEEDMLALQTGREGCYLSTGMFGTCLRLIERELPVECCGEVLLAPGKGTYIKTIELHQTTSTTHNVRIFLLFGSSSLLGCFLCSFLFFLFGLGFFLQFALGWTFVFGRSGYYICPIDRRRETRTYCLSMGGCASAMVSLY